MLPIITWLAAAMIVCGFIFCAGPRLPGIVTVAAGAAMYRLSQYDTSSGAFFWPVLIFAAAAGEVAARMVRRKLYRRLPLSLGFAADATAGGLSGAFVGSVVFGPVAGLVLWQVLAGKNLLPRWDSIYLALRASFLAGMFRYLAAAGLLTASLL